MADLDSKRDELASPDEMGTAPTLSDEEKMARMTRRALLTSAAVLGGGALGLKWLNSRRAVEGIVWPLRVGLESGGQIGHDAFSSARLAPQFAASQITRPARVNGDIGLGEDFDPKTWNLNVEGASSGETLQISLAQIKKLPRREIIMQFKCIEGWSTIVGWSGVRLSDFIARFSPFKSDEMPPFVGLQTPDGEYYVSLDMESALHPQTLLAYAINSTPLSLEHGAPLRLVVSTKYGIKHLKRIGTLTFSTQRPPDYWAERGYDWFSGH